MFSKQPNGSKNANNGPERFNGHCNVCHKYGNRARDCRSSSNQHVATNPGKGVVAPEHNQRQAHFVSKIDSAASKQPYWADPWTLGDTDCSDAEENDAVYMVHLSRDATEDTKTCQVTNKGNCLLERAPLIEDITPGATDEAPLLPEQSTFGSLANFEFPIPIEDDYVKQEFLVARKTTRLSTRLPPIVIRNSGTKGLISVKSLDQSLLRFDPASPSKIELEKVQEAIETKKIMPKDKALAATCAVPPQAAHFSSNDTTMSILEPDTTTRTLMLEAFETNGMLSNFDSSQPADVVEVHPVLTPFTRFLSDLMDNHIQEHGHDYMQAFASPLVQGYDFLPSRGHHDVPSSSTTTLTSLDIHIRQMTTISIDCYQSFIETQVYVRENFDRTGACSNSCAQ